MNKNAEEVLVDDCCIRKIIEEYYAVKVLETKPLQCEIESKYFVKLASNNHFSSDCFVFKIWNAKSSVNCNVIDALCKLLVELKSKGINVCVPIKNAQEHYFEYPDLLKGRAVQLVTFLEGKRLCEVPYTTTLLKQVGKLVAQLNNCMQETDFDILRVPRSEWSPLYIPQLRKYLPAIIDNNRRNLVEKIFCRFERDVLTMLSSFPKGLVHNDLHGGNIIVKPSDQFSDWEVSGIIDFVDCHASIRILDLVSTCTYAMLQCHQLDPFAAVRYIVCGYASLNTITRQEYDILFVSIAARLAQSILLDIINKAEKCGKFYLNISLKHKWVVLGKMLMADEKNVLRKWQTLTCDQSN